MGHVMQKLEEMLYWERLELKWCVRQDDHVHPKANPFRVLVRKRYQRVRFKNESFDHQRDLTELKKLLVAQSP